MQSLEVAGKVKRVKRQHQRVLWAAPEYDAPPAPFGAQSATQVAMQLIKEHGPMTMPEIVVAMQSRGYRPDADPRVLHNTLWARLKGNPEIFSRNGAGRWVVTE